MTTHHQQIANDLGLFFFSEVSPGSCIFLPPGARIYNNLMAFIKKYYRKYNYQEVVTPNIADKQLWTISGHWDKYQEHMFQLSNKSEDDARFALKSMNCPFACLIFEQMKVSYKQLPLRLADFGVLHRNELTGALRGLTRVRRFQQDDAHIFCSMEQIESEIEELLKFIDKFYTNLGFKYKLGISTRPQKYIGEIEIWNQAENILQTVVNKITPHSTINSEDGAFYGPKIDITIQDSHNREHQCATIQLDFNLPERFDLKYIDKDQQLKRPIIIHRAILGSFERFIAILLEHTNGRLPFYLSPRHICIMTIPGDDLVTKYAHDIISKLHNNPLEITVENDESNDDIRDKIKSAELLKYNYIVVIGKKELEKQTLAVRSSNFKQKIMSYDEFRSLIYDDFNFEL